MKSISDSSSLIKNQRIRRGSKKGKKPRKSSDIISKSELDVDENK
jgi:hypothetical protein